MQLNVRKHSLGNVLQALDRKSHADVELTGLITVPL